MVVGICSSGVLTWVKKKMKKKNRSRELSDKINKEKISLVAWTLWTILLFTYTFCVSVRLFFILHSMNNGDKREKKYKKEK